MSSRSDSSVSCGTPGHPGYGGLMTETQTQVGVRRNRAWTSPKAIFLLGVVIIPTILAITTTAWASPNDADYVRMAFASVIGATVAVVTVVALWILFVLRRNPYLFWYTLGSVVIIAIQMNAISSAAHTLLDRLALS